MCRLYARNSDAFYTIMKKEAKRGARGEQRKTEIQGLPLTRKFPLGGSITKQSEVQ